MDMAKQANEQDTGGELISAPSNALLYWSIGIQVITLGYVFAVWQQVRAAEMASPPVVFATVLGLSIMLYPLVMRAYNAVSRTEVSA